MGDGGSGSGGRGVIHVFFSSLSMQVQMTLFKILGDEEGSILQPEVSQSPGLRDRVGQGQRWNRYKVTKEKRDVSLP